MWDVFTLHSQCLVVFPLGFSSTLRRVRNCSNWNHLIRPDWPGPWPDLVLGDVKWMTLLYNRMCARQSWPLVSNYCSITVAQWVKSYDSNAPLSAFVLIRNKPVSTCRLFVLFIVPFRHNTTWSLCTDFVQNWIRSIVEKICFCFTYCTLKEVQVNLAFSEGFNNIGLWENIFFEWNLQETFGKLLCIIAFTGLKQLLFVFLLSWRIHCLTPIDRFCDLPFFWTMRSLSLWAHRLSNCHILCRVTFNLPIHLFPLLQIRA